MASLPFFLGSAYLVFERNTLLKHALPVPGRAGLNEPLLAECWVHFERACGLSQGSAESWSLPPQEWALLYRSEPGTLGQGKGVTEQPNLTQGDKCCLSRAQFPHLQECRLHMHPGDPLGFMGIAFPCLHFLVSDIIGHIFRWMRFFVPLTYQNHPPLEKLSHGPVRIRLGGRTCPKRGGAGALSLLGKVFCHCLLSSPSRHTDSQVNTVALSPVTFKGTNCTQCEPVRLGSSRQGQEGIFMPYQRVIS